MTDMTVTAGTFKRLIKTTIFGEHLKHQITMAPDTILLYDPCTLGSNHDRFVEILECKGFRMFKPVLPLGQILGNKAVRHMAVVARGVRVVTSLLPPVVLVAHDMTVGTSLGGTAQISQPLSFTKSIDSCTQERSK